MKREVYRNQGNGIKTLSLFLALSVIVLKPAQSQNIPRVSANEFYAKVYEQFPNISILHDGKVPASLKKTITIHYRKLRLKEVLLDIAKKGGFRLIYNDQNVPLDKRITLDLNKVTINEALWKILEGTGLRYALSANKHLILLDKHSSKSQEEMVSGTVTDGISGETMPGVNIVVKRTSRGTSTDNQGDYELSVPSLRDTLLFSFIGYQTKEIPINGRSTINVALHVQAVSGQEVVVVGYGTQNKQDLTGSVSQVSSEDISNQPTARISDALQGQSSGVNVTKATGAPGATAKIRIRGANSITGSNDPLVVIDGFVGGDLSSLDPDNIASVDILKDASATAMYGSRGSNGVIIITTKKGQEGKTKVSFETYQQISQVPKKFDLLGPREYAEMVNQQNIHQGVTPTFSQSELENISANGGTDWQDEIFRSALTQNYQLSLKGGNSVSRYYVSGGYTNDKGILINTNFKKYSLRFNFNSDISDKFDVGLKLHLAREKNHNTGIDAYAASPIGGAVSWAPNLQVYSEIGGFTDYTMPTSYGSIEPNPVFEANEQNSDGIKNSLLGTLSLTYDILKGLTLTLNETADYAEINTNAFNRYTPGSEISASGANVSNSHIMTLQSSNILSYTADFNSNNHLKASVIYEYNHQEVRDDNLGGQDFSAISLGYYGMGLAGNLTGSTGLNTNTLISYIGRVNYTFMNKYLLTGTYRIDGSSRFAEGNKYSTFPSLAVGWRLIDESFMTPLQQVFSDFKLRASWGVSGNQGISSYRTLSRIITGVNYPLNPGTLSPGVRPGAPANEDLKWEETIQYNIGFDIGILNGRLQFTGDYYHKKTNDLLVDIATPYYTGNATRLTNIGSVENKGADFTISGQPIAKKNISWHVSLNVSKNINKVLDLGNPNSNNDEVFGGEFGGGSAIAPTFVIQEGKALGSFYGLISDGVWKSDEAQEAAIYGNVPGDAKYKDLDGNGKYDDLTIIGNALPNFTYGFNNHVAYKNFDLNLLFTGTYGNDIFNYTRYFMIAGGADIRNPTSRDIYNRWTPENEDTDIPAFNKTSTTQVQSSRFIEDGSYLRLKNVTLGYNFQLQNSSISSLKLYLTGHNLYTLTNYRGYDPEVNTASGNNDVNQGLDSGGYPVPRSFLIGLEVNF